MNKQSAFITEESNEKIVKENEEEKLKELKKELKRRRNCERQRAYYQRQKIFKKNDEKKKKKKVPKTNAERQREFRQRKAEKSYVDMKRRKLCSNEENVVQGRAVENIENVTLQENQFHSQQLHNIYEQRNECITPEVILHRNTGIPGDDPARVLKKSAVPSVFDWDKTVEEEQSEEQPSSVEDAMSFISDLLVVEVEEPTSAQETVSFNPERVKATYSKGQTAKSLKPNADPSLQTKSSTFTTANAKNASNYTKFNPKKRTIDLDDDKFLITAVTNNGEKKLKLAKKPPNNSNIVGKVFVTKTKPQNKVKITPQCLPLNVTDKEGSDIKDEMLTSCLPLEVKIEMEEEVETPESYRLTSSSLPSKVTIKTEPEEKDSQIEVEIELLPIKQENNEEMVDINL